MLHIEKRYIVDEQNRRIAVQLDIDTFEQMLALLEDYGLVKAMEENDATEALTLEEARAFYRTLPKSD